MFCVRPQWLCLCMCVHMRACLSVCLCAFLPTFISQQISFATISKKNKDIKINQNSNNGNDFVSISCKTRMPNLWLNNVFRSRNHLPRSIHNNRERRDLFQCVKRRTVPANMQYQYNETAFFSLIFFAFCNSMHGSKSSQVNILEQKTRFRLTIYDMYRVSSFVRCRRINDTHAIRPLYFDERYASDTSINNNNTVWYIRLYRINTECRTAV